MALAQDLRYSVRALARTPGFTASLVTSAAIGIGANAVVFGFIGNLVDPANVMPGVADDGWQWRLMTIRVLLTTVSIFVFVISASSVIGLLLSRGAARVHETAVRVALGAQRRELFRPLIAEGIVVGLAAVVFGLLVAFWTVQGLPAAFYAGDVEALPFVVDWPGLLIATIVGTLAIFGTLSGFPQRFLWSLSALHHHLSLIGVTGVTSDAVARRTPEIALRMALGAPRWRIVGGVVAYGARLAAFGATAGVLVCLGGFRFVPALTDGSRGPEWAIWIAAPAVLMLMMIA